MKVKTQKIPFVNSLNKNGVKNNVKSSPNEKKKSVQKKSVPPADLANTKKVVKNAKNQMQLKNGNKKPTPEQAVKPLVNKKTMAQKPLVKNGVEKKVVAAKKKSQQAKPESEEEDDEDDDDDENENEDEEDVDDENEEEDEDEADDEESVAVGKDLIEDEAEEDDDEEEDEEYDDEEEDDDEDENVKDNDGVDEDDSEDEEVEAEEKEGNENDVDDDDDDESPEEAPVSKKEEQEKPKEAQASFATGPPAKSIPKENIVYLKNVPDDFPNDIIFKIFKVYGAIKNIHRKKKGTDTEVIIAFAEEDAAISAMLFKGAVRMNNIEVPLVSEIHSEEKISDLKERTVIIKNSKELIEYISACGEVQYLHKPEHEGSPAFIAFATKDGVENALKKNKTQFNGEKITVRIHSKPDAAKTIQLCNAKKLETLEPEIVEKIFEDCGEIERLDMVCSKSVIANVTFKDLEGKEKALEKNGTTAEGIILKIRPYFEKKHAEIQKAGPKTTIFVSNIAQGTSEEQIREFFEQPGKQTIKKVTQFSNNATIEFDTVDNFCNAFRHDESVLNGNQIYIKPNYSKDSIVKKRSFNSSFTGNGGPPPKRRFDGPPQGNSFQKRGFNNQNNFQGDRQNNFQNGGQQFRGKPFFQKGQGKPFVKRENGFQGRGGPGKFQKKPNGHFGPKFSKPNNQQQD